MSTDCLVSIVVPVYNAENYIEQCLDSITSQTLDTIEVIVVDDGSTDATSKIVEKWLEKDKRIRLIKQTNQFAGVARNNGMDYANGKYLSFLDADDFFDLDMFTQLVTHAEKNDTDITICSSLIINEDDGSSYLSEGVSYIDSGKVYTCGEISDYLFQSFRGWAWDKLFKKSFIDKHNLRFQALRSTNDAYFVFMAMALADSFVAVDKTLVYHRVGNPESIEGSRWLTWENCFSAAEAIEKGLRQHGLFNRFIFTFYRWFIDFSIWNIKTLPEETRHSYCNRFFDEWLPKIKALSRDPNTLNAINLSSYLDESVATLFGSMDKSQPDLFIQHIDNCQQIRDLEEDLSELDKQITGLESKSIASQQLIDSLQQEVSEKQQLIDSLQQELGDLKSSLSYRIGRGITYIPRAIVDAVEHIKQSDLA